MGLPCPSPRSRRPWGHLDDRDRALVLPAMVGRVAPPDSSPRTPRPYPLVGDLFLCDGHALNPLATQLILNNPEWVNSQTTSVWEVKFLGPEREGVSPSQKPLNPLLLTHLVNSRAQNVSNWWEGASYTGPD